MPSSEESSKERTVKTRRPSKTSIKINKREPLQVSKLIQAESLLEATRKILHIISLTPRNQIILATRISIENNPETPKFSKDQEPFVKSRQETAF